MNRTLMQHGDTSLTITLPKKWIAKHKLKKGDEVSLSDDKGAVVVSTSVRSEIKKAVLDTEKLGHFNKNYLNSLYKSGCDEITVLTPSLKTFNDIQDRVANMIGYEIFDRDKDKCVIKSVSKEMPEEFDALFRKAFLVTIELADEVYSALCAGNLEQLKQIRGLEQANNKFTELCARILYKHSYKDQDKLLFIYCINRELEKVADRYKYLADFVAALLSSNPSLKLSHETLALLKETNEYLRTFYKLFYKFDASLAKKYNDERYLLIERLDKAISVLSKKKKDAKYAVTSVTETVIICYLKEIVQLIYEMHNPYYSMVL